MNTVLGGAVDLLTTLAGAARDPDQGGNFHTVFDKDAPAGTQIRQLATSAVKGTRDLFCESQAELTACHANSDSTRAHDGLLPDATVRGAHRCNRRALRPALARADQRFHCRADLIEREAKRLTLAEPEAVAVSSNPQPISA